MENEESLYKCPDCGKESTQTGWNDSTKGHFGINITPIEEASQYDTYRCPKCEHVNVINAIKKVVKENEKI